MIHRDDRGREILWPGWDWDFRSSVDLRGSQLVAREVLLNELTVEWNPNTEAFDKPGGTLRFPDAPDGVYVAYSNRDKTDPNALPVKFAFAQQRTDGPLQIASPPDADPVVGYTHAELVDLGWQRSGTYGEGRFARGGHAHQSPQAVITPTLVNRPSDGWINEDNPPAGHLARFEHAGWQQTVDIGGRTYGTRALSWWPTVSWAETGEVIERGGHATNHYYRAPDDWAGPMVPYPEGTTNTLMPSDASWESLLDGGWYVGPDRFLVHFTDHKVSGDKVYEITQTLNFPELLSLDRPPGEFRNAVALVQRDDGYRNIFDRDGNRFTGKCWRSQPSSVTAGPDPALGRDDERWVVVPALRLFTEFAVPEDVGWVPKTTLTGAAASEYYGRFFSFSTAGLAGMPNHQHGEYLATFALGRHYPALPGMPDWIEVLNAVAGWDRNHLVGNDTVWNRGCEAVHLEGIPAGLAETPWPQPVESWDGQPLEPVATSRARITVTVTSGGGSASAQKMIDARSS